jgi:hypothetical protein
MLYPDEWTQEEYLRAKKKLQKQGISLVMVDTILSPIDKENSILYNPYELKKYKEGSVFVFYCESGKNTKERLNEYKKRFPKHHCISLYGGKAYWRKNMMILDEQ